MAAKNVTTAAGRVRLAARAEPYYTKVAKGRAIGFRKNAAGGTWLARFTEGTAKTIHRLGSDTDLPDYDDALLKRDSLWPG